MKNLAALAMLLAMGSLLVGCGGGGEESQVEVKTAEATPAAPMIIEEVDETVEAPPKPVTEEAVEEEAAEEALEEEGPPPAPRPSLLLRMLPRPVDNAMNANVQSLQETVGSVVPLPSL